MLQSQKIINLFNFRRVKQLVIWLYYTRIERTWKKKASVFPE